MLIRARTPRLMPLAGVVALTTAAILSVAVSLSVTVSPAAALDAGSAFGAASSAETAKSERLPELTLAPTQAVLLSNDETAEFELWISNRDDVELPAGSVVLTLSPDRVTSEASLETEFSADSAAPLVTVDTPAVPAGEGRLVTLSVPRAEWPLTAASDAGVYRVQAVLTAEANPNTVDANSSDAATSELLLQPVQLETTAPLVWRGAGGLTRVQLTPIVPMLLPDDIASMPRRGELDALMRTDAPLEKLLSTAEARGATLAIDPRVVAGVRAYGDSASASSREFVDRLVATTLPSFALQFADADPSAQAALGFSRLLAPDALSFVSRFGVFPEPDPAGQDPANPTQPGQDPATPGAAAPDTAATDIAAGDPAAPDTAVTDTAEADTAEDGTAPAENGAPSITELSSWNTSLPGTAWPAADTVTGQVLELLERNGYSRVLASDDNVAIAGGGARGTEKGIEYLVSDSALSAAVRVALAADTETEHRSGVAQTSALLVLRAQADVPGTVVTFDRRIAPSSPYTAELLDTIAALPWVETVSPDELPEARATLLPAAEMATPLRVDALSEAVAREPLVRDYSRVLVNPEYLIDLQRVRLLQLFSARYTTPGARFESAAERAAERDAETLQGVRVVTSTHTQLVGTTSRVPIQVRNTLSFDALMTASVVPTSAALVVTEAELEPLLIPGDSSANLLVPVRTRVSSGESGLAVDLSAESGGEVVSSGVLDISIRSSWETLALGSLGVLTAGFFGFGIWRSIRRRSRTGSEDSGIVAP